MNIWRKTQKVDIISLNAMEVAQQLSIMEYRLYDEIRPGELLAWSSCQDQSSPKVKNLARFLNFNRSIARFVAFSILTAVLQRRCDSISYFLEVAEVSISLDYFLCAGNSSIE